MMSRFEGTLAPRSSSRGESIPYSGKSLVCVLVVGASMIEIDGKGNIVMHLAADLKALAANLKALAALNSLLIFLGA